MFRNVISCCAVLVAVGLGGRVSAESAAFQPAFLNAGSRPFDLPPFPPGPARMSVTEEDLKRPAIHPGIPVMPPRQVIDADDGRWPVAPPPAWRVMRRALVRGLVSGAFQVDTGQ